MAMCVNEKLPRCLIDFSFELVPITRGLVSTRLWPLNNISDHEAKLAVKLKIETKSENPRKRLIKMFDE